MNLNAVQTLLQNRQIAYAITDADLTVVEVGGAVDILENEAKSWLGHSLLALAPELVGNEDMLADILVGEKSYFELLLVNRDLMNDQTRYLNMVALPYRNQTGQITGLLHLVDDVTEMGLLKQLLAQNRNELHLAKDQLTRQNLDLAAANAELKRLDELKSAFVSIAAHELRTPLTSISGYVEVLLDSDAGSLTQEQIEYLEIVQNSASRLLTITENLLDVTRIEAGQVELALQPADLSALVKMVAAELEPQLAAKRQHLQLNASSNLPLALCDTARAVQIIGNLVSNAIKYTSEEGAITISLALAEEVNLLQVSVADNGIGLSSEDQKNLFNRFFRAKSAYQTGVRGAGLGLHITRSLVELHGGRIWFESEPGRGSTFFVTFPTAA